MSQVPIAPAEEAAAPQTAEQPKTLDPVFSALPEEVKGLPVVKAISVGSPPAVRVPVGAHYPDLVPLEEKFPEVLQAGLDLYKASTGDAVLFNPLFMSEQELQEMDQTGKLAEYIPEYGQLMGVKPQVLDEKGMKDAQARADKVKQRLNSFAAEGDPAEATRKDVLSMPETAASMNMPAKSQNQLNKSRIADLTPSGPTSGAKPGGGRIINDLMKNAH